MQGHLAGPIFPSAETGSSIVDVDVDVDVDVSMEGPFEKIVGAETQAVSHDTVVRVLVPFLLWARLRKMETDNWRSCHGLQRLLSESFGSPKNCKNNNDNLPPLSLDNVWGLRWVQSANLPLVEHTLHARSTHSQFFLTQEAQGLRR